MGCCVESTMRTACEKGFNVVTLTDCCATTSQEGHAAATSGTFGMFSTPMSAADFAEKLPAAAVNKTPTQDKAMACASSSDEVSAALASLLAVLGLNPDGNVAR